MKTVLIVDDNPTNLRILEMLLKKQGCSVVAFTGTAQALAWTADNGGDLDLAILDFEMDEMNGDCLALAIREGGFEGNCLILTALGTLDRASLVEGSRIQAVLNKPINMTDIAYIIKRWASTGREEDARSEPRSCHQVPEQKEIFLFQSGTYHALNVRVRDCSDRGNGYLLQQGTPPDPGAEIMLSDGQNYSVRWVRPCGDSCRFGVCRIEPLQ